MFRTVLVHVDSQPDTAGRTAVAIAVAKKFDATLIGMAAGLPRLPIEIYDAAFGTVAVGPEYTEMDRKDLEAEFGRVEDAFNAATRGAGVETGWRAIFGPPSAAIIQGAIAADLAIVGPGDRSLLGNLSAASAGDVVLRSGRPVLVVPDGVSTFDPKSVVIAWKDTAEAQRAIANALPFLKGAASVVVLAIDENDESKPGHAEAVAFLLRHGIAAKSESIPSKGADIGEVLLSYAKQKSAGLIVAGAYGHSRVREWVLGGVTRALLNNEAVPVLFSH
jgi:nucleotide-binding universal stress UspA family protein